MRFQRSATAVAAAALAAGLLVSGCSTERVDADVVLANGTEPQNPLIPTNTNEVGGGHLVDRLFAGLRRIDADGSIHDEVAQSVESPDQQHFTIRLKPGWVFSNGEPVTARSYADAWNYGALITNAQLQGYAFTPIQGFDDLQTTPPRATSMSGLRVLDDLTMQVDLKAPTIDFRARLAYAPFYPLPAVAYRDMAAFGERPIGNGPYRMAGPDAWQHEVRVDLVRNESYRGGRPAKNEKLSFLFYQSFETAYADLLAGNLDLLDNIPNSALSIYRRELGSRAISKPAAVGQWIGFPGNLAHFTGEEGRLRKRAISMSFDRERISQAIFRGARIPAHDFTAPVLPGYNGNLPGSEVLRYNPAEAKKLWAQANAIAPWSGVFLIGYNADGDHQAWIDAAANGIRNNLGIEAQGFPYPTFKQARQAIVNHTINKAFRYAWQGDYPTLFQFLEPNFVSGSPTNDTDYRNPQFDQLLIDAEAAPDERDAYRLIGQAQEMLLRDLPAIPALNYVQAAGYSERVTGAELSWNGTFDFENVVKTGER